MINVLKKNKTLILDMILNIIGFGIYIFSQQILLLPISARIVNDEIYASIVLYISILNVVCNVTGGELGNVRLIMDSEYKKNNLLGDFCKILLFLSPIIIIILFPLFIYLKYSVFGIIFLILTILMANVRLYSTCYYRLEQKFNKVIIQNLFYFVGIIVSLIIFKLYKNIYILLFIPECISVIYALRNSDLLKMRLLKTNLINTTLKKYSELGIVSLLNNLMDYIDKFIVYPILGSFYVAVYYAVNSMSKITNLITNPIASVILSWISNIKNEKNKDKVIKYTILVNIPIVVIVSLITIPLTYVALKILYIKYFIEATKLIIPIAIISGFSTASSITKSVLLKYCDTKKILFVYILYFVFFIIIAFYLSKVKGLVGFTIANLLSRFLLWIIFIIMLISARKMEGKNESI